MVAIVFCFLLIFAKTCQTRYHFHAGMTNWLTVEELARHLRTVPSTIYKLKQRGQIRGYRVGRQILFDVDEVDADIKSEKRKKPSGQKTGAGDADQHAVS